MMIGPRKYGRTQLRTFRRAVSRYKAEKTYIMRAAEQTILCGVCRWEIRIA